MKVYNILVKVNIQSDFENSNSVTGRCINQIIKIKGKEYLKYSYCEAPL